MQKYQTYSTYNYLSFSLSDEDKELEDDKEIKQALSRLCQEVSDLEQAIGKIAAPNMKAGNK